MVDSATMTTDTGLLSRDLVLTYEKEGSINDRSKAKELLLPKSFFNNDGVTKERNQPISFDDTDDEEVKVVGTSSSRISDIFATIRKYDASDYGKILFQENADVFKFMTLSRDWVESGDCMRVLICGTKSSTNCILLVRDHDNDVCFERSIDRKTRANFHDDGQPTMVDLEMSGQFNNNEKLALKFRTTPQAESFLTNFNDCCVSLIRKGGSNSAVEGGDVVSPRGRENANATSSLPSIFGGGNSAGATGLSFASLSSNQLSGFTSNAGQQFSGAGKTLFGCGARNSNDDGDTGGDDVYVEPIVQLASVSTTSGEEEEDCFFNQRCKLYRFDSVNTKKWKERGVGEMKLLRHRGNTKARLVMRRDQVRKLCANHYLVEQMSLAPFKTNDLTVTWMAYNDVSEGAQTEDALLAAKFKNQTILSEFKQKFDLLKSGVATGLTPIIQKPPEEGSQAKAPVVGACDPKLAETMKELKF